MLTPDFAGELFGPGQPLDANTYFIILPDALGAGGSSKPSDGLRTRFPAYNYDDMVLAQHRLLTEHLNIRHLRLLIGNSMGGMHAWCGIRISWTRSCQWPHNRRRCPAATGCCAACSSRWSETTRSTGVAITPASPVRCASSTPFLRWLPTVEPSPAKRQRRR
ncbi:alpha/beta fold hydrolase [Paraburkholderia hospita]